ncbi:hypothetical protein GCM10009747_11650 [Agromyces humatus]|uniref:Uncharacterized protein n=1 Tax=Agromyces humatus TaxID=279573 RepID=A0ABP4WME0_9MICO
MRVERGAWGASKLFERVFEWYVTERRHANARIGIRVQSAGAVSGQLAVDREYVSRRVRAARNA